MNVRGFVFGDEQAARTCAIVGSMRGNEVQQAFICARLVSRLCGLERNGALRAGQSVLVIPCVNPHSMNILKRFWPADASDVNRMFPGDEQGETTGRIAAGILRVARTYAFGIQLCSFNQPGDFLPHVRITHQGPISDESLGLALDFGLPYVMHRKPTPFDKTTLNYVWQASGTHAFSLYSRATDRLDERSALEVEDAVLRFLAAHKVLGRGATDSLDTGVESRMFEEQELVDVRTQGAAGYLVTRVQAGDRVVEGQELAQVCDAFDAHVLEVLRAPVDGRVFFMRRDPLVMQHMVVFRIVA
jgi:hypothetical protein